MTKDEAIFEMRYYNVSEEDIETILNNCHAKNILPQFLDDELEKLGYDRFFCFEYDDELDDGFMSAAKPSKKHQLMD
jgi:hypothetical protein